MDVECDVRTGDRLVPFGASLDGFQLYGVPGPGESTMMIEIPAAKAKENRQLSEDDPWRRRLGDEILRRLSQDAVFMSAALRLSVK
ncbi:Fe2+-dependent dioxygenase [Pandoraea anapnoica]|uniref:Fe2+-dependent dioxygenase n=1 Tax=Pandoraea anapnoica TaxID=2508301 RepID=A0A5E4ZNN6_9BURK|nr:hypothetical protein [Pandoraea anapnoica]VVE62052.1 Fe2+-dependent dioxygenase [Pandoraea anapnoica]